MMDHGWSCKFIFLFGISIFYDVLPAGIFAPLRTIQYVGYKRGVRIGRFVLHVYSILRLRYFMIFLSMYLYTFKNLIFPNLRSFHQRINLILWKLYVTVSYMQFVKYHISTYCIYNLIVFYALVLFKNYYFDISGLGRNCYFVQIIKIRFNVWKLGDISLDDLILESNVGLVINVN